MSKYQLCFQRETDSKDHLTPVVIHMEDKGLRASFKQAGEPRQHPIYHALISPAAGGSTRTTLSQFSKHKGSNASFSFC